MQSDRSHWPVRRFGSFDEMSRQQIKDWQACTATERLDAAWDLVVEAWEIKGRDPNELRLQRSVTRVLSR